LRLQHNAEVAFLYKVIENHPPSSDGYFFSGSHEGHLGSFSIRAK
jgi:hypothetical protein